MSSPTKRTVVGSLQPRNKPTRTSSTTSPATAPKNSSPSSTRSTRSTSSTSTSTRSTRSSGQATHYQALVGAPSSTTPSKGKKQPTSRKTVIKQEEQEEEEESEDELMLQSVTTPTKKRKVTSKSSYLPSPARSRDQFDSDEEDDSSSGDEAQVEKMLIDSPKRKRAAATATKPQLLTPESTPSKKRSLSSSASTSRPINSSPLKQSTTPSKRRASAVLSDSDEQEPEENEEETKKRKPSTPRKTPSKPTTQTPKVTPTKVTPTSTRISRSTSSTPSRSSLRKQRLPPNLSEIKNAPAELRNRLVGYHMEDEGYGVAVETQDDTQEEEEEQESESEETREKRRKEKGKSRAIEEEEATLGQGGDAAMVEQEEDETDPFLVSSSSNQPSASTEDYSLPIPPSIYTTSVSTTSTSTLNPDYPSSFLHKHLSRQLSILTGASLPEARLDPSATVPSFDRSKGGVMGYPFLAAEYEEWEKPMRQTLNEVVTRGMGNAIVLLGPRGVGKTMLIERTLRVMKFVHQDQHEFVTVRLSGLVHTTDRLALRSIAMQMREQGFRSEGETDQLEEGDYSSNSATMSTLLRLLEPSSSTANSGSNESSSPSSKPIILIVDEFDLFALHPRQSFLYCLLDIVQGNRRRGGVGVVGVSSRVDCLSLLEKRVRSRCQSHVLQMMLPSSLTSFLTLTQNLLSTDSRLWELVKGQQAGEWAKAWNGEVERWLGEKKVKEYFEGVWRVGGNTPTELRATLTHFVSKLGYKLTHSQTPLPSNGVPRLEYSDLKPRESHLTRDISLKSLSTLELIVLISCKHLSSSTVDFQSGFNLEMVHSEYLTWTKSLEARGKRVVGKNQMTREAFCSAFDTLRRIELILPLGSTTSTVTPPAAAYLSPARSVPFKMHRLVPREAEIKLEVEKRRDIDGELKKWGTA
ncbi:uncharacterized protein JCM6883_007382 [Sporobolomyces salmoneus]|uniref:uncharacterized protein n=1 Tax=Sporobolomyces salmoneus TaxID=183962 RepID=UPI003179CE5B